MLNVYHMSDIWRHCQDYNRKRGYAPPPPQTLNMLGIPYNDWVDIKRQPGVIDVVFMPPYSTKGAFLLPVIEAPTNIPRVQ